MFSPRGFYRSVGRVGCGGRRPTRHIAVDLALLEAVTKRNAMAQFDTLIRGGTVVDGTRVPRYRADIGIKDGKIAQIGGIRSADADQVLEANGLSVAAGFVYLHTHYD